MRELNLNGYIDEEAWFGDEITPESLHDMLYGEENEHTDDVHIRLNSYGGSCNAATRMFDDICAYPGAVRITVSGTAASAATVVCMAADRLEITPGSLLMIHDPSTIAIGNERDMDEAKAVLRASKESILNMYGRRMRISRNDAADMMTRTSWMDANQAFEMGFVDGVTVENPKLPQNATLDRAMTLKAAQDGVQAWFDRRAKPFVRTEAKATESEQEAEETQPAEGNTPEPTTVPAPGNTPETAHKHTPDPVSVPEPPPDPTPDALPPAARASIAATDARLNNLKY